MLNWLHTRRAKRGLPVGPSVCGGREGRDWHIRLGQAPALKPDPGPAAPRCRSRQSPWRGTGAACAPALLGARRVPEGCAGGGDPWGLTRISYCRNPPLSPGPGTAVGGLTPAAPAGEAELTVGRDQARCGGSPGPGTPGGAKEAARPPREPRRPLPGVGGGRGAAAPPRRAGVSFGAEPGATAAAGEWRPVGTKRRASGEAESGRAPPATGLPARPGGSAGPPPPGSLVSRSGRRGRHRPPPCGSAPR